MRAEIWMGSSAVFELEVKRVDISVDGVFIKLTDIEGNVFETSPNNVILIHSKEEKGGEAE